MPTRYQTDPYGRTRQYGPSPYRSAGITAADLYDVPEMDEDFSLQWLLDNLKDIDLGPPVRNIGKFLGAAAGLPGVELPEEAPAPPSGPPSFMQEWGSNVARNLRSAYGTPSPTPPSVPEPPKPGLASVIEQKPSNGWMPIPGDPTGKFRDPGAGTRFKGGPFYVSERPAGVPEWQRPESVSDIQQRTSDIRLDRFKRFSGMDPTEARTRMYQQSGIDKPYWSTDELFEQIVNLPSIEADARIAESQKLLGIITDKEQQRRENAWLAQATSGGRLGATPSEGLSTEGLKRIQQIITGSRADERLENEQARLAESERRGRAAGPSRSDIITRTERLLLEKGMTVKKTPEGDLVVYQNNRPIKGGEQILAATMREAERQLRAGAP